MTLTYSGSESTSQEWSLKEFDRIGNRIDIFSQRENYPDRDARLFSIFNMQQLLAYFLYQTKALRDIWFVQRAKPIQEVFPDNSNAAIETLRGSAVLFTKRQIITTFLFDFEVFLKEIRTALSIPRTSDKYFDVCDDVLKGLQLDTQENIDKLILPSIVRNSLHNGGLFVGYRGQNTSRTVDGHTFDFTHNTPVKHVHWEDIIFYFDKIVDVLDLILAHNDVTVNTIPRIDRTNYVI